MAPSASATAGEKPDTPDGACRTSSAECGASAPSAPPGLGNDILDQQADQPAHEFVHQPRGIERRIGSADVADDPARQRDGGDLVEAEQVGAQTVVDVVGVVGDIVGQGGDLRFRAGEAPELQVLHPGRSRGSSRECRARDSGRAAPRRDR